MDENEDTKRDLNWLKWDLKCNINVRHGCPFAIISRIIKPGPDPLLPRDQITVSCLSRLCVCLINFPFWARANCTRKLRRRSKVRRTTDNTVTDWRWVRGELRQNQIILDPATSTSSSSWYRTEIELERDESQIQDSLYLWSRQDSCLQGNGRNNVIIYLLIYVEVHLPDHHIHPPPVNCRMWRRQNNVKYRHQVIIELELVMWDWDAGRRWWCTANNWNEGITQIVLSLM